eukprot:scaffold149004_cov32-Prasinocladus_malaysianus.AAC.1
MRARTIYVHMLHIHVVGIDCPCYPISLKCPKSIACVPRTAFDLSVHVLFNSPSIVCVDGPSEYQQTIVGQLVLDIEVVGGQPDGDLSTRPAHTTGMLRSSASGKEAIHQSKVDSLICSQLDAGNAAFLQTWEAGIAVIYICIAASRHISPNPEETAPTTNGTDQA